MQLTSFFFIFNLKSKAMKTTTTIFLILAAFSQAFSQADLNVQTDEIMQANSLENLMRALSYTDALPLKEYEIEGSAYYCDSFRLAEVSLSNGMKYKDVPVKYNVYNDIMEIRGRDGLAYTINNSQAVDEIILNEGPKFVYTHYINKGKSTDFFAEVLVDGNARLLKQHSLALIPAQPAGTHTEAQPPKFVKRSSKYFLQIDMGNPIPFKNTSQLLKLLAKDSRTSSTSYQSASNEDHFKEIVANFNSESN